jgi:hypothetical protein
MLPMASGAGMLFRRRAESFITSPSEQATRMGCTGRSSNAVRLGHDGGLHCSFPNKPVNLSCAGGLRDAQGARRAGCARQVWRRLAEGYMNSFRVAPSGGCETLPHPGGMSGPA